MMNKQSFFDPNKDRATANDLWPLLCKLLSIDPNDKVVQLVLTLDAPSNGVQVRLTRWIDTPEWEGETTICYRLIQEPSDDEPEHSDTNPGTETSAR